MLSHEELREKLLSDEIVAYCQEKTAKLNSVYFDQTELSEKAQQVKAIIEKSDFGCQKKNVCQLMSIVLEENIVVSTGSIQKSENVGAFVRNNSNDDARLDDDYRPGEVVLILGSQSADSTSVRNCEIGSDVSYWTKVDEHDVKEILNNMSNSYSTPKLRELVKRLVKLVYVDAI